MQIIVDVPAERAEVILEVLRNFPFVKSARPKKAAKPAEMDTTEYLLASPANAAHLRESIAQLRRGQTVQLELPAE